MKVLVTVCIDVDEGAWAKEYGTPLLDREIRGDVRSYVVTGLQEGYASTSGIWRSVEQRAT